MGNFAGPGMGYNDKRRILPGVLSSSPRRAQPVRPLPPTPSDVPGGIPDGNQPGKFNPQTRIDSNYTSAGAGGDSPGVSTSNPLGTSMGNNAAANVGMTGLMSALSGIPGAAAAHGQGISGSAIANALFGNTMGSMLGPAGIMNSLLGMAYAGYQGNKAAKTMGLSKTGTASQAASNAINTPLGIVGQFLNILNPSQTAYTALEAASGSQEAQRAGIWKGSSEHGAFQDAFGDPFAEQNAGFSPGRDIAGPSPYGMRGYSPNALDMTAIGGRWGPDPYAHQGDPMGGNQGGGGLGGDGMGSPGVGGLGGETGATGQGEGDDW